MKSIVKTSKFSLSKEQIEYSRNLGISQDFLRLLLGRGMKLEEIGEFLHPSIERLSSPYEIDGMDKAVQRIKKAIANKEKVLIYGDYDCDGICATSTLMLFFKDKLDVFYFIPNRHKDGYGISIDALERVLYNQSPTLVITVDCGITAVKEVEYLKCRGIDVIVTDHHEPQEVLPDCIIVDPKVNRKGFYDLCGAGVALKLVEALSSRQEACKYLDIVSIATIADVVPLLKDNRIIAYYGLRQISQNARKGIRMLMGENEVSAQDVMFKLAPRMNAAGRLNSAMKVVGLFLENDYFLLKTLTEELERDNAHRQGLCEKAVNEAKAMLKGVDFAKTGLITLYNESWEAGILGIACARLVEEFKRPVILFAKNEDELKGSARSVEGINIFELLVELSPLFTAFGGHAQAAGVSLKVDNFEEFKQRANEIILSTHSVDEFEDVMSCEMQLSLDSNFIKLAKELEMLEPTGYQNPLPTFMIEGENLKFDTIGFSKHVKYSGKNLDILGFSRYSNSLYPRIAKLRCEATLGINEYQNRQSAQGIIRSLIIDDIDMSEDECNVLNSHQLLCEGECEIPSISLTEIKECLTAKFGTLIVCFNADDYKNLCRQDECFASLSVSVGDDSCLNPESKIIVCPSRDYDYSFYDRVVIASRPLTSGYLVRVKDSANRIFAYGDVTPSRVRISDDTLRTIYKEIVNLCSRTNKMSSPHRMYVAVCSRVKVNESVFRIALDVFSQLSLVKISDRGVVTISKKSSKLIDSVTYRNLAH